MWFNFRFWTRPWWTWSRRTPTSRRGWPGTRPSDLREDRWLWQDVTWSQNCSEICLATLKSQQPAPTCSSTFNAGCDGKAWWGWQIHCCRGVTHDHYHCWSLKCRLTAGHIHTNKSCKCKHTSKQPSAATWRRRIRLQSTWWIWQSPHVHTHLHTHLECWSHSHHCDLVTARLHDVKETESVSCAGGSNVLLIHKQWKEACYFYTADLWHDFVVNQLYNNKICKAGSLATACWWRGF